MVVTPHAEASGLPAAAEPGGLAMGAILRSALFLAFVGLTLPVLALVISACCAPGDATLRRYIYGMFRLLWPAADTLGFIHGPRMDPMEFYGRIGRAILSNPVFYGTLGGCARILYWQVSRLLKQAGPS